VTGSRTIIIAGAGIGGLTAALALARRGFAVTLIEAAAQLDEVGAGIQLSPNATEVLLSLGLGPGLKPHIVAPETLRVMNARSGRVIVESPLGLTAAVRYRAPFWVIHRGDLQNTLAEAVRAEQRIDLRLGVRVEEFGQRNGRLLVVGRGAGAVIQFDGDALIGADGVWSAVRSRLGDPSVPSYSGQMAWRALVPVDVAPPAMREPATTLWLGPSAHVVHYPVRAGRAVNIVVILREPWNKPGWTEPGDPAVLRARAARWAPALRALVEAPQHWTKWALHGRPPLAQWGAGPATLLGDAAHPMRPFLAQGAAMAIEDAAVLARSLAARTDDVNAALRSYEQERQPRAMRVVEEADRNGRRYGWRGPLATARNFVLARMGGEKLLTRYDWIYDWKNVEE
jgi:salicylate hydroxylase